LLSDGSPDNTCSSFGLALVDVGRSVGQLAAATAAACGRYKRQCRPKDRDLLHAVCVDR